MKMRVDVASSEIFHLNVWGNVKDMQESLSGQSNGNK